MFRATDILLLRRAFRKAGMANALRAVANGEQAIRYLAGWGDFADRAREKAMELNEAIERYRKE